MLAALGLLVGAWEGAMVNSSPRQFHFSLDFLPCLALPIHGALFSFGMGVDQVVEVELVGADGSLIVANGELTFGKTMISGFKRKWDESNIC